MKKGDKYKVSSDEDEKNVLDNFLKISDLKEMNEAETEGIFNSHYRLSLDLSTETKFDLKYILEIHRLSFGEIYSFAGKLRKVDMSKGGFAFPSAKFLEQSMFDFERDILSKLPQKYSSQDELIDDIAKVHAELLFIHPFREGNGRTARVLAYLMAEKAGYNELSFRKILIDGMKEKYIIAVQQAGMVNYEPMRELIWLLFQPD